MGMSVLSKQKATTLTRAAQVALALLIVGAGSALAVSARSAQGPEHPGKLELPTLDLGTRKDDKPKTAVDSAAIAARFAAVVNHPTPVEVVKVEAPVAAAAPAAPASDLKYLGAVGMGDLRMALFSEDGKQKFLGVGDSVAGATVQSITDGEVQLSGGRTVALAGHSTEVVTRSASGRPGGPMNGMPGVAGMQPGKGASGLQGGLAAYNPQAGVTPDVAKFRSTNNIPDYVSMGLEQEFVSVRDDLRNSGEKFQSDDHLNEAASKRLEEKRIGSGGVVDPGKGPRNIDKRKLPR